MKTTIDIPKQELEEVIRFTRSKTKRDAVITAIRDFNRRQRLARLTHVLGSFEEFMTADDLKRLRQEK
ncbi:MAG: type II toxin-antitoxin system VapB family antitoxin [Acidobacteria bacterium]|nr:type II toxin-antitoxin system VapB family antitoxin [Acidobacteriota bacterium]